MAARPSTSQSAGSVPTRGLKSKFQIGSIHGRLNFESEETAFPYEYVCPEKRKMKIEVIKGSRPQILSKSKKWNSSVQVDQAPCAVSGNQISKYDQSMFKYNFRAEVLPDNGATYIPKSSKLQFNQRKFAQASKNVTFDRSGLILRRAEEMPVHPKLHEKPNWNHSTTVDRKSIHERAAQLHERSRTNSNKQKRYLLANYKSPLELENERKLRHRAEKEAKKSGVKQKVDRSMLSSGDFSSEHNGSTSDNWVIRAQSKTKSNRRYKEYYNDGVWEYSPIEGCHVWSCSMNTNQHFRGSSYKVRNPDAWNFASP